MYSNFSTHPEDFLLGANLHPKFHILTILGAVKTIKFGMLEQTGFGPHMSNSVIISRDLFLEGRREGQIYSKVPNFDNLWYRKFTFLHR